jgi:hypothetical protein
LFAGKGDGFRMCGGRQSQASPAEDIKDKKKNSKTERHGLTTTKYQSHIVGHAGMCDKFAVTCSAEASCASSAFGHQEPIHHLHKFDFLGPLFTTNASLGPAKMTLCTIALAPNLAVSPFSFI